MLRKVESLEIKDGRVITRVRAKPAEATGKLAEKRLPSDVLAPDSVKKGKPPSEKTTPTKLASQPAELPSPKR